MYGADVNPAGEEVRLSVVQQEPANKPPVAKIKWAKVGDQITLDATGSTDADGTIKSYSWYLNTSEGEQTKTGTTFTFPRPKKPQSVMLAVTDDDGATAFDTVSTLPMDVLPGLRLNPIVPSLRVPLPVSILSTADFDATKLDTSTLRLGRGEEKVMKVGGVTKVDLNHDKRKDLLLLFWQPDVGIKRGDKSLCMTGDAAGRAAVHELRRDPHSVRYVVVIVAAGLGALFGVGCLIAALFELQGFGAPRDTDPRALYLLSLGLGFAVCVAGPLALWRLLFRRAPSVGASWAACSRRSWSSRCSGSASEDLVGPDHRGELLVEVRLGRPGQLVRGQAAAVERVRRVDLEQHVVAEIAARSGRSSRSGPAPRRP